MVKKIIYFIFILTWPAWGQNSGTVIGSLESELSTFKHVKVNSQSCLNCHKEQTYHNNFNQSVHKDLNCTACHTPHNEIKNKIKNDCQFEFKPVSCQKCHESQGKAHEKSVHNSARLPVKCYDCHSEIHQLQGANKNKIKAAETCVQCHQQQENYFKSNHHQALLKGKNDAASCTDCHGVHEINALSNKNASKLIHTQACLKCHDDSEMMSKNEVTTVAAKTFFHSYHGKNVKLGFPDKVAGCSDCHTGHAILDAKNPESSVNKNNIVKTCQNCHKEANALFTQFASHGDDHDSNKFPILYWTRVSMTSLLVGTFIFFWLHSILWFIRAYFERKEHFKKLSEESADGARLREKYLNHLMNKGKKYHRFKTHHIILHLVVVTSFITLSLTGLPLKFADTTWAAWIMNFIGGSSVAGILHRTAAIVTFGYFFVAIIMSFRFLFKEKPKEQSFISRLLDPDSLFPNLKDLRDVRDMFKWFLFVGEKPKFDRWTYWEKFDFLAVFWGMLAIGLSGLLLWFPVFFSKIFPGWIFNVATIIHSDEALLATGFIFTVHFFNTHFRPDKFPMDMVIFNGEMTEEEMKHERPLQYERWIESGQLDSNEVIHEKSNIWNLIFRIFGFSAVFIGISLFIFMAWTHFSS